MAWIRTAVSLISFGFTIYKFFQYLKEKGEVQVERIFGPREFALVLIAIGLMALLFATIQNRREMKLMRQRFAHVPYSMATVVAGMVGILGVIAFIAVVFRQ
jgi:inner membrane protein YidH